MNWQELATRAVAGGGVSHDEALAVLGSSDDELLAVLQASFTVRHHYWGRGVRIHKLENAKSGMCRENCAFCSQAIGSYSGVDRYEVESADQLLEGARRAHEGGAVKYCIVTATRGPSDRELAVICEAVRRIKSEMPIEVCTSLGLLTDGQACRLAEAGVDRFNHNLETSDRYFPTICQTHTYEDRIRTLGTAREAGMEICCGGIMGMGETWRDRVDLAFALKEIGAESIPVNFLDPRPGTPLAGRPKMSPTEGLRCLAMFRFVNPSPEIRAAGGREVCLGSLQPLALYPANSIFSGGYLTTGGQGGDEDRRMIEDAGFHVEALAPA